MRDEPRPRVRRSNPLQHLDGAHGLQLAGGVFVADDGGQDVLDAASGFDCQVAGESFSPQRRPTQDPVVRHAEPPKRLLLPRGS
jgi:hypothetical protein